MALLYVFRDLLSLPLPIASLATAELSTLLRFPVNDRWVFENLGSSWTRLWQFHVAQAGSFSIFWLGVNGLALLGVHYLLAAAAATCCTASWSIATHFLWIWRAPPHRG